MICSPTSSSRADEELIRSAGYLPFVSAFIIGWEQIEGPGQVAGMAGCQSNLPYRERNAGDQPAIDAGVHGGQARFFKFQILQVQDEIASRAKPIGRELQGQLGSSGGTIGLPSASTKLSNSRCIPSSSLRKEIRNTTAHCRWLSGNAGTVIFSTPLKCLGALHNLLQSHIVLRSEYPFDPGKQQGIQHP
ncbi:MAG: hypothetical protein QM796_00135 [Chthoniobacteraceae bacterium]